MHSYSKLHGLVLNQFVKLFINFVRLFSNFGNGKYVRHFTNFVRAITNFGRLLTKFARPIIITGDVNKISITYLTHVLSILLEKFKVAARYCSFKWVHDECPYIKLKGFFKRS